MITIAIPFFRDTDLLRKAIQSVLSQTSAEWRLIVVDDSGAESGRETVQAFSDPRIRYVSNLKSLGMAPNWNHCLHLADTPYATLLHADDKLEPCYVDRMLAGWKANPSAALLYCRAQIIDQDGSRAFSLPDAMKSWRSHLAGEGGLDALLRGCFIFCPTVCFRRDSHGQFPQFSTDWKMVQDFDLWAKLLLAGETLVGLPFVGYAYRRHAAGATALYTQSLLRFEEEAKLYEALENRCLAKGWKSAARRAHRKTIVKLNIAYCAFTDLGRGHRAGFLEKLGFLGRVL
ncbi:glycosyltransferase [bacterium]|nr:glycosyltransferase [bacterium]